jgi:heat shock protein HslJ
MNIRFQSRRSLWRLITLNLAVMTAIAACAPAATPAPVAAPMSAPSASITGILWQWTSLTEASQTTAIPNPALYTIVFNTDGTVKGKADCNTFSGTYSTQNGFTIKVSPDVMSACGTLDSQYISLLNQVAAGGPDGAGGLALETAGGAQRLMFRNGGPAVPPAAPTQPAASSIQNIVWQWTNLTETASNSTMNVPNFQSYTIVFRTDGTLTGQADCNSFSGTYSQQNGFTITLGPTTLAACGEGSLSQQYLNLLSSVAAGGPNGAGGLVLETAGGAQRLTFIDGGAAPQQ